MPVLNKGDHTRLERELKSRIDNLTLAFKSRPLVNNREGAKKSSWVYPESKCATTASDCELRMAVKDFKTILSEIRMLK